MPTRNAETELEILRISVARIGQILNLSHIGGNGEYPEQTPLKGKSFNELRQLAQINDGWNGLCGDIVAALQRNPTCRTGVVQFKGHSIRCDVYADFFNGGYRWGCDLPRALDNDSDWEQLTLDCPLDPWNSDEDYPAALQQLANERGLGFSPPVSFADHIRSQGILAATQHVVESYTGQPIHKGSNPAFLAIHDYLLIRSEGGDLVRVVSHDQGDDTPDNPSMAVYEFNDDSPTPVRVAQGIDACFNLACDLAGWMENRLPVETLAESDE